MMLDPFGSVIGRMPLILGNGIWDEDIYRYHMFGTSVANSGGNTFALVSQDDWTSSTSTELYVVGGASPGTPFWYTNGSYAATTSPAAGATTATTGLLSQPLASSATYGGANPTTSTHYIQTASAIRVRPISAQDTTSGVFMVAYTKDSVSAPLDGVDYGTVKAYGSDVVTYKEMACSNWNPGEWLEMPAVPVEREAFASRPAVGTVATSVKFPAIGFFATGCASGQAFEVEAVAIYQFEIQQSDRVKSWYYDGGLHDVPPTYGNSRPTSSTRSVRTNDEVRKMVYQASRVQPRRLLESHPTIHPKNPRTQQALKIAADSSPTLWQKIKGLLGNAGKYVTGNLDKILLGAAKFLPMLL
jgi:hypothetical protein